MNFGTLVDIYYTDGENRSWPTRSRCLTIADLSDGAGSEHDE